MANANKKIAETKAAFILFVDIVGFSKLKNNKELEMISKLGEIALSCPEVKSREQNIDYIVRDFGDGLALAFLYSPEAPVKMALKLSENLKFNNIPCRMGVHFGSVSIEKDLNNQQNLIGSGMNIAQRVMDCGNFGHILASSSVYEWLIPISDEYNSLFHYIGPYRVKHDLIIELYNIFTEEIRNKMTPTTGRIVNLPYDLSQLIELTEKDNAESVAWTVFRYFSYLQEDERNLLLIKLSSREDAIEGIIWTIAHYFYSLPEKVRNLLFDFAKNDKTAANVVYAISCYFNALPNEVRNLLFEIAERGNLVADLANAIDQYFDNIEENTRNQLLIKLLESYKPLFSVGMSICNNFDKVNDRVRKLLLSKLSKEEQGTWGDGWNIANNIGNFRFNAINFLIRQKEFQIIMLDLLEHLSTSSNTNDKIRAIENISIILLKTGNDFVLPILKRLAKDKNEEVKAKAKELIRATKKHYQINKHMNAQ